jgi:metal-responsive CopG/Arc/MetJ family transcriptional regulator
MKKNEKTKMYGFILNNDDSKIIDKAIKGTDFSRSQVIRRLINKYLRETDAIKRLFER